ncbi:MAG: aminotransferase class III-fold pyridoxal phosphate-dependent enzyme [Rikenellaceae bacterium]
MNLFDVYPLWDIEPVKGLGCKLWDKNGVEYLDLYGGHAVISVGHSHPTYVERISEQVSQIGFYSNSVQNSLQRELAEKLGEASGYVDYSLFLCSSGAEANENALKLASFQTGRKEILALKRAFHGRTSGAVEATDNPKIQAPFNQNGNVTFVEINDIEAAKAELLSGKYAAFIIEAIQGVAGIRLAEDSYLQEVAALCEQSGTMLIFDEVQSGYGRSGNFFAHQKSGVKGDIITAAKGIANGFPMGAVLVSDKIEAKHGMLGTTFGGSHLACAAAIAVLDIIKAESLVERAKSMGEYIIEELSKIDAIATIRGRGLMIGFEVKSGFESLRSELLHKSHIFTGTAAGGVVRLLPPLVVSREEIDRLICAIKEYTK